MKKINIGVLDGRRLSTDQEMLDLADWIVLDRIGILTGFMSPDPHLMQLLALEAEAVTGNPFLQMVRLWDYRSRGWVRCFHPGYFMLFGNYRHVRWSDDIPKLHGAIHLGRDIVNDLVDVSDVPEWDFNKRGNVYVPSLGNLKQKDADWRKWFSEVFQTCLWLGTSTPSKKVQNRWTSRNVVDRRW